LFGVLGVCVTGAVADDKTEYNRRAAQTHVALFKSLDRDADASVSRVEAQGDLNFVPHFDDMDINRDGIVTTEELHRYIELRYGVRLEGGRP
jgi:hypothetical protein